MLTRQTVLRLLLLGLLLAALIVPVAGMGISGDVDAVERAVDAILVRGDGPAGQPAAIIACDDPGGSGGSSGGC